MQHRKSFICSRMISWLKQPNSIHFYRRKGEKLNNKRTFFFLIIGEIKTRINLSKTCNIHHLIQNDTTINDNPLMLTIQFSCIFVTKEM